MLTQEELEAIRKRAEKATEGNWYCLTMDGVTYDISSEGTGIELAAAYSASDAEFIANAREDIPKLLAEIDRLRNKELEYRRMLIRIRDEVVRFGSDIDRDIFDLLYKRRR